MPETEPKPNILLIINHSITVHPGLRTQTPNSKTIIKVKKKKKLIQSLIAIQSSIIWKRSSPPPRGLATLVCRVPFDPVRFQKQERSQQHMASPSQASGILKLRSNSISCSEPLRRCQCNTGFPPLYNPRTQPLTPQLLFFFPSIYIQTFPSLEGTLGLATVLVVDCRQHN